MNSDRIKAHALDAGFDLCGIATAAPLPEAAKRFRNWLDAGYQAEMEWLARHVERRNDPRRLLEEARSVILLGLNYFTPDRTNCPDGFGRISKYARGKDYHKVIRRKTEHFLALVQRELGGGSAHEFKWWVDYGPFFERAYAEAAGLGYIGKNGMLINKEYGSWIFLSEVVTTLDLEPDRADPIEHGKCATCRLCMEACPTEAILSPRTIDSARCISYLTIERPSAIPDDLAAKSGDWLFGCDICQDVCPHNLARQKPTRHAYFHPQHGAGEFVSLDRILDMDSREEFLAFAAGTPLVRPRLENLQRNARIVRENQRRRSRD